MKRLVTYFFLFVIWVPLFLSLFGIRGNLSNSENRSLEPLPEFSIDNTINAVGIKEILKSLYRDIISFKNDYHRYYQDNFILKEALFDLYTKIQINLFYESPLPKSVVLGNNGWFFLGDSYSNVLLESTGITNFSREELDSVQNNLLQREEWLSRRGISYYVAVAPNKHTIYGEYLPISRDKKPTKWEQLKAQMHTGKFNLIDLSLYYKQGSERRLYHKTDSHWNDLGAFLAYKALVRKISEKYPEVKAIHSSDIFFDSEISFQQDLTRMLNIKVFENKIVAKIKDPRAKQIASILPNHPEIYGYEERFKSNSNNLKILVFRDSFGSAIKSYINESFGESVFIWSHNFDKDLIELEKPDIVIHILVERSLDDAFLR